jgi:RNA polymerase sigma-70 factor (ECF subfamily)
MDDAEAITAQIPHLRRYSRALMGDRVAADDLVQDTLERAWRRFGLWRRGSDLRAWLFTIMHNLYVNQRKVTSHVQRHSDEHPAANLPGLSSQDIRLELKDLNQALQRLPDEQREVVLLIGLEQLSYDEAAKALGVPIGTVMSRLSRGREQLRALMNRGSTTAQLKLIK